MEGKRGQLIPYDRMSPRTVPWDAGEQVAQSESERCWTGDGERRSPLSLPAGIVLGIDIVELQR
jgi:hypothetical protein